MSYLPRLLGLILLLVLMQLAGCAGQRLETTLSTSLDSTVRQRVVDQFRASKVKFTGPVSLQIGGSGNLATTTDATKAKAPVAAAPDAVATETRQPAGPSWYLLIGLVCVGLVVGVWLRSKL